MSGARSSARCRVEGGIPARLRGVLNVDGADLVWTGRRELPGAAVACADGRVTAVGALDAAGAGDEQLDATGCVVIPGLVNAHHHLLQSAFRTLPGSRHVPMGDWLGVMAAAYRRAGVDPELGRLAARVGLAESLLCGVTTVADHHLTWPADADPLAVAGATVAAARELGARLVFVRGTAGDDPEVAATSAARHRPHLRRRRRRAGGRRARRRPQRRQGDVRRPRRGRRPPRAAPPHPGQRGGRRGAGGRALRASTARPARRVGLAGARRHPRPPVRHRRVRTPAPGRRRA